MPATNMPLRTIYMPHAQLLDMHQCKKNTNIPTTWELTLMNHVTRSGIHKWQQFRCQCWQWWTYIPITLAQLTICQIIQNLNIILTSWDMWSSNYITSFDRKHVSDFIWHVCSKWVVILVIPRSITNSPHILLYTCMCVKLCIFQDSSYN